MVLLKYFLTAVKQLSSRSFFFFWGGGGGRGVCLKLKRVGENTEYCCTLNEDIR